MSINYNTTIVTTTPYTATSSDEVILVDVTSGPKMIMLPAPSGSCKSGRALYIKDYSGTSLTNPITIKGSPGKLIDGVSFAILNGGYSHIQVMYDGANWMTIS